MKSAMKKLIPLVMIVSTVLAADFTRNPENQTVYDPQTDLTWLDTNDTTVRVSWADAIAACNTLDHAGFQDWRLPNFNELISMLDLTHTQPSLDPAFVFWDTFDGCGESCVSTLYWSSTTYESDGGFTRAYAVDFNEVSGVAFSKSYNTLFYRCVRSGAIASAPQFISNPPTTANVGESYDYLVHTHHANGLPVDVYPSVGHPLPAWLTLTPPSMQAGYIDTFAGDPVANSLGDGGLATAALLDEPQGIASDGLGNYYIADTRQYRIRKVDSSGTIFTVAGTGNGIYSGDGLPAITSGVGSAQGMATDAQGILHFVDTVFACVRKIDADDNLVTVAGTCESAGYSGDGGPATAAQLFNPLSIAFDSCDNLYIADTGNSVVRKVDALTGTITTVAGTGSTTLNGEGIPATTANLNWPSDVTLDAQGNLYIADQGHCRVWRVNRFGIIERAVGTGTPGDGICDIYSGDGNDSLATSTPHPYSVAIDSQDNIFVSLKFDNRIIKIDATSNRVSTVAGNGNPGYIGDGGPGVLCELNAPDQIAVDENDNLFIAETGNSVIRELASGAYRLEGIPTTVDVGMHDVNLTAEDNNSKVDYQNFSIHIPLPNQVPIFTSLPTLLTETLNTYTYPIAVTDPDGDAVTIEPVVLPSWLDLNASLMIDTIAGDGNYDYYGDGGPATAAALAGPLGLAFDTEGNLYIADSENGYIRKVDGEGAMSTIAGNGKTAYTGENLPADASTVGEPRSIAFDSRGILYFADWDNGCVRKIDGCGNIVTVAGKCEQSGYSGDGGPATDAFLSPEAIAFDANNNLYIVDSDSGVIRRVDAATQIITTFAGTGSFTYNGDDIPANTANLSYPLDLTFDPEGNLYIADEGHCRVRKITIGGVNGNIISTVAGTGICGYYAGDGDLAQNSQMYPLSVSTDADGTLFIGVSSSRILRINPESGLMETIAGDGNWDYTGDGGPASLATLTFASRMANNPAGILHFADTENNVIRRVYPENYFLSGTPSAFDAGIHEVNLTVKDGRGGMGMQEFNITVAPPANTPPTALDGNVTTDEDTPYTFKLADFHFSDADANDTLQTIQITSVTLPAGSTLRSGGVDVAVSDEINASEFINFVFTPAPDAFADAYAAFNFKVYDGSAYSSAEYTMTIHVLPVNDAPLFSSQPMTTAIVGNAYAYTVTLTDPDGETSLGFSALVHPVWLDVTPQGTDTFLLSGTPQIEDVGVAPVLLEVRDADAERTVQEFNITVVSNNTPPTASDGNISTDEDTPYAFNSADFHFSDNDTNDTLQTIRITALNLPAGSMLRLNSVNVAVLDEITAFEFANLVFTPAPEQSGSAYASFRFKVHDGIEYSAADYLLTINVVSVNDGPPVFTSTALTAATQDVLYSYSVTLSDPDNDPIALIASIKPVWLALTDDGNGTFTLAGTPGAADVGLNDVTLDANDGKGGTAQQSFVIIVNPILQQNEPPVATFTAFQTLENTPFAGLLSGTDPEGEPITCLRTADPAHGTLVLDTNCSFRYTPSADYDGTDQFTYSVFDGELYSAAQNVAITVINVNNPPVATSASFQTREDTILFDAMTGTDTDNDPLTCTVTQLPNNATLLRANTTTCSFSYRPNPDYFGSDTFSYFVSDAEADSAPATVDITVTSVNDVPSATLPSAITVNEDDTATVAFSTSDVEGDPVRVTLSQNALNGTVMLGAGRFTYTPLPNFNGSDAFALTLDDGNGGTRIYNIAVAVTPEEDLPLVTLEHDITVLEDSIAEVPYSLENPDNLSVDVSVGTVPAHGTTAFEAGKLFYIPSADYFGADSFTVEFRVGNTTVFVGTVTVTVNPVNDSPTADVGDDDDDQFDVIITDENTTQVYASIQVGEVLESNLTFSDIDGDTLSVSVTVPPAHGSVTFTNAKVSYVPQTDYVGPDAFALTVNDGQGASHTVNFIISINAAAAIFRDINISLGQKEVRDFLANVQGMFAENPIGVVTLRVVTPPAYGMLLINATAANAAAFSVDDLETMVYQPTAFYFGPDTLTFEITDTDGALHSFNVNLDIEKTLSSSQVTYEPGWHLITLPSIGTMRFENAHVCWQYRLTGDTWLAYSAKSAIKNTYEQLGYDGIETPSIDTGYWCKNTETMTVEHFDDDQSTVTYDTLPHGWNLVGTDKQIDTAAAFENTVIVWYYNNNAWAAYSPHEDIRDALRQEGITVLDTVPEKAGIWVVR